MASNKPQSSLLKTGNDLKVYYISYIPFFNLALLILFQPQIISGWQVLLLKCEAHISCWGNGLFLFNIQHLLLHLWFYVKTSIFITIRKLFSLYLKLRIYAKMEFNSKFGIQRNFVICWIWHLKVTLLTISS